MQATIPAAATLILPALLPTTTLSVALQAAASQRSAASLRLQEPTNLLEPDEPGRKRAHPPRQAAPGGSWRSFRAVMSHAEDPEAALPERRRLAMGVEATLGECGEDEGAPREPRTGKVPGCGEEDLTERNEDDG